MQPDFQKQVQSIEQLLAGIEASGDPAMKSDVRKLMQIVMDLHGAGIERMLEVIRANKQSGEEIVSELGRDDLVGSLLVLYGVHPLTLEARISEALTDAKRRFRSREGEVELLSVEESVVRLRLVPSRHSCSSTTQALKDIVEDAVCGVAPDATLVIETSEEVQNAFVPLETLLAATEPV